MRKSDTRRVYYSRWLVSRESVIEDAALELDGRQITFVGSQSDYLRSIESESSQLAPIDLGESVIIPGLINCHVHTNFPAHTNLSFESGSMVSWVKAALDVRFKRSEEQQKDDISSAIARMQKTGIVAIGEIANDFISVQPILNSGLVCRFFAERLGFPKSLAREIVHTLNNEIQGLDLEDEEHQRVSFHQAPHAPYSCSAELIDILSNSSALSTIHLAENFEEVTLFASGAGPWRERLKEIGKDDPSWTAPKLSPVKYLESLGVLRKSLLLAHVVHVDDSDIRILADSGSTVVLCPSSNAYIKVGTAPVDKFLEQNIPLALGTDSLASNADLDLFAEMKLLRELFPDISRKALFEMGSINGAEALGFAENLGELKVGYSPGVFAVDLRENDSEGLLDFKSDEELFDRVITVGSAKLQKLADAELTLI